MTRLDEHLAQARDHLRPTWNDEELELRLLHLHRRHTSRVRRRRALAACATVAVVAAVVLGLWGRRAQPALEVVHNAPPALERSTRVEIDDGSTWEALARDTEVVVNEVSARRVRLALVRGRARFAVEPQKARRFQVQAGPVQVEVIGTRFNLELVPASPAGDERVRVQVASGRVRVAWPEGDTILSAGDERWLPPLPEPSDTEVELAASDTPAPPAVRRRPASRQGKSWRALARRGSYNQAYRRLQAAGGNTTVEDEPRDLFLAADTARLSGHPERALPYLQRIIERHRGDERAPLASFTLGRVLMTVGRPERAASAFAEVAELDPQSPLLEAALAREVLAWSEAGQSTRAESRARAYEKRFPHGSRVAEVRRWAGLSDAPSTVR